MKYFLAFDLGASSGRAMLGTLHNSRIELEEIHRFDNGGVEVNGSLYWNLLGLFSEMKTGLRKVVERGIELSGIAVDTWGVDYALLDRSGQFTGLAHMYRDPRTNDIFPFAFDKKPREEFYAETGIQFMPINTVFQLASMKRDNDPGLEIADKLLFMPNALTYLLCGDVSAEYTIATTGQLYNPFTKDWAWDIIKALELPTDLFPPIKAPGTIVGKLNHAICREFGCEPIPVILVGSHDTASAVAAVPATNENSWVYLSSGTWSLFGVELDEPLVSEAALNANYTNEGGICGKIRFLKNIMGLWLIQESRSTWQRQGKNYGYREIDAMAEASQPFKAFIDPNDERFMAPGDMPERIREFCRATGQPVPETEGEIARCAFESLALRYRHALNEIEVLTNRSYDMLHLVGGGSQNKFLNRFTANALGRPVVTGPVEATALGNIACQALALGDIRDLQEIRQIVGQSVETERYEPEDTEAWEQAYTRFVKIVG